MRVDGAIKNIASDFNRNTGWSMAPEYIDYQVNRLLKTLNIEYLDALIL